ncbi:MAG: tetratricopeptide repeat protein [Helicobacteraceae bacterium]|jgi:tetratricopeptide (TPR) repeat protein|nr:tetratricopeptide repeat protein [Helicobacteraceae bacterium]
MRSCALLAALCCLLLAQGANEWFKAGAKASDRGDYQEAIKNYSLAIETDPKHLNSYLNRASAYYYIGEYNASIADNDVAVKLDPNNASAFKSRGVAYFALGEYNASIADLTKAIKIDPSFDYAYYYRALAYLETNRSDEAKKDALIACDLGNCDLEQRLTAEGLFDD